MFFLRTHFFPCILVAEEKGWEYDVVSNTYKPKPIQGEMYTQRLVGGNANAKCESLQSGSPLQSQSLCSMEYNTMCTLYKLWHLAKRMKTYDL